MKAPSLTIALLTTIFLFEIAGAQYSEKWNTPTEAQYLLDVGNTDGDPQEEILVGYYYEDDVDSLILLDGATGAIEWSYGMRNIYMGLRVQDSYSYGSDFGPKLSDVDADGVDEIIFWTGYHNPPIYQFHCFDSDVSLGVDDEKPNVFPGSFKLGQNSPNPFNPVTTIEYTVPQRSHVTITIYNILGQELATIVDEEKAAGEYSVVWNGKQEDGKPVSSGVYFYALKTDELVDSKKMLLLK